MDPQTTYDDIKFYENAKPHDNKIHGSKFNNNPQYEYENVKAMNLVSSLKKRLKITGLRNIDFESWENSIDDKNDSTSKPIPAARNSAKCNNTRTRPNPSFLFNGNGMKSHDLRGRTPSEHVFVENDLYEDGSSNGYIFQ